MIVYNNPCCWFDLHQTRTSGLNHLDDSYLHCLVFREHHRIFRLVFLSAACLKQLLYNTSERLSCQALFWRSFWQVLLLWGLQKAYPSRCLAEACCRVYQNRYGDSLTTEVVARCSHRRLVLYYTLSRCLSTLFLEKVVSLQMCTQRSATSTSSLQYQKTAQPPPPF